MKTILVQIKDLEANPWQFRMMPEKDFESLQNNIRANGFETIPQPIIAKINKKYYIVDGHARINAAANAQVKEIKCGLADWIINYQDLRVWSFRLNRQGYSNPLVLSDMINEDIQILHNMRNVADIYGVNEEYISSLVQIKNLHDDTKAVIQKIMNVARKKYQFLLEQISPAHLSSLAEISPQKQVEVVDWIFHDIMYGPADESLVSIPSIYEIINEITKVQNEKEKKKYKKSEKNHGKEIPFTCKCGAKYDVDAKSHTVYEFLEQDNVILRKEVSIETPLPSFSSKSYSKKKMHEIIDRFYDNTELKILVSQREYYENWQR